MNIDSSSYMFAISHISMVMPGTNEGIASVTRIRFLAVTLNALTPENLQKITKRVKEKT